MVDRNRFLCMGILFSLELAFFQAWLTVCTIPPHLLVEIMQEPLTKCSLSPISHDETFPTPTNWEQYLMTRHSHHQPFSQFFSSTVYTLYRYIKERTLIYFSLYGFYTLYRHMKKISFTYKVSK